jgi:hypothetical protein
MKPLLFIGTTTATIYGSLRCEAVFYLTLGLFILGVVFAVFYSAYRHLSANRYF